MKELFEREITVRCSWENEIIKGYGKLSDTYHEMEAEVDFEFPSLKIIEIKCKFIRYPHPECPDALKHLEKIKGIRVGKRFYEELHSLIGGKNGCVHLNLLIHQIGMSAVQARFAKYDEMAPEEMKNLPKPVITRMYLQFMPGLKNTCIAWAEDSPMVKEAEKVNL